MTLPSTGKATIVRLGVILFSACMMGGFVWYSHIKAQPKSGETEAVAQTTQATILPGSKRSNGAIVPEDIERLVVNKDGFTIDLNLAEPAGGQSTAPTEVRPSPPVFMSGTKAMTRGMRAEDVPKGAGTTNFAGSPIQTSSPGPAQRSSQSVIAPNPPQSEQPVMLPGSKAIAQPIFKVKPASSTSPPAPPASQETRTVNSGTLMLGSKSAPVFTQPSKADITPSPVPPIPPPQQQAAPARNPDTPIFTSSKSGPIFQTDPRVFRIPGKAQKPASKAPPEEIKTQAAPKPQAETPAPASP